MSDTLQEGEDQMDQHQVNKSGTCVIPGCPCRGWSAQETAGVKRGCPHPERHQTAIYIPCQDCSYRDNPQLLDLHEPAARSGGDEWRLEHVATNARGTKTLFYGDTLVAIVGTETLNDHQRALNMTATLNQHQSLVAERERLERMLAAVVNAHYGLAYRSIGSGDGIPEKEAAEIGRWWLDYTASDA